MLENNETGIEVAFGDKSYKYHYLDNLNNIPAEVPRFELVVPTLTRNMGKTVADVRAHLPKVALTMTQESMLDQGFTILVTDGNTHAVITPYIADMNPNHTPDSDVSKVNANHERESWLSFQMGGLDMVNQNGRMYPTAVLEKAIKDYNAKPGEKLVSEVRLHNGDLLGNVNLDMSIKHDMYFAMRAHKAVDSEKLNIVSWDMTHDEKSIPFTAVKQVGSAVREFAEKLGSRLSAFLVKYLIYVNQGGTPVGFVSKEDFNAGVGRGSTNPSMSIDLGDDIVACRDGKAFLNDVHVLQEFSRVIAVTYGDNHEPLWIVEAVPKVIDDTDADTYELSELTLANLEKFAGKTLADNPTLQANVEKYRATQYGEAFDNFDFLPPETGNYGEPAKAYFATFAEDGKLKNASLSGTGPDILPNPTSDLCKSLIDPNPQLKDSNMEPLNEQVRADIEEGRKEMAANIRAKETHFVIENAEGVALHEGIAPRGLTDVVHILDQSPFAAPWDLITATPEDPRLWNREENRLLSVDETKEVTEDLELGALAEERLKDGMRVPVKITDEGIVPKVSDDHKWGNDAESECAGDESYALKADMPIARVLDIDTSEVVTALTPSDFTDQQLNEYVVADPTRIIHCNDGHVVELPNGEIVRVGRTLTTELNDKEEVINSTDSYRFLTATEELNAGANGAALEKSIAQVEAGETVDMSDPANKIGQNSLSGSMPSHEGKAIILGAGVQSGIAALAEAGRGQPVSGAGMSAHVTPKVDRKAEAAEHNAALAQMPPTTYPIIKVRIDGFNIRCEILELTWRQMENDHKIGKYIVARPRQEWGARRISGLSARGATDGRTSNDILPGALAKLVMQQMDETTAFEIRHNRLSASTKRKFQLNVTREVWIAAGYNTTSISVLDV